MREGAQRHKLRGLAATFIIPASKFVYGIAGVGLARRRRRRRRS